MKLTKAERELLNMPMKRLKINGAAIVDGSHARWIGQLIAELGQTDKILIANVRRKKMTVILDLGLLIGKGDNKYGLFTAKRLKVPKIP